jgi:hypothetical protein
VGVERGAVGRIRVNAAIWTARGSLSQTKSVSRSLSASLRSVIAMSTTRPPNRAKIAPEEETS